MTLFAIATVLAPFAGAALATLVRYRPLRRVLRVVFAAAAVGVALSGLPHDDPLSAVFVTLVSVLSFVATILSQSLLPESDADAAGWASRPAYFALLGAFWSAMLWTVQSPSFVGIWIGISSTTLVTTFLVAFAGGKAALEAAWKYLVLCSFGIAIALVGILLLGRAETAAGVPAAVALDWRRAAFAAPALPGPLARVALVLMVLGFGTKAGLVPMHAWLPDAHSKAPAPVSALLSGLLVSCALYAIVRVRTVAAGTAPEFCDAVLLALGCLSVLVAGTLMLAQRDLKRLLSYSTVEHAGLATIALGLGTPLGLTAALLHVINHALVKSLAFFSVGLVQRDRGTTAIGRLHGLWNDPGGKLLLAALIGLMGLPPFGLFVSEVLVVVAAVAARAWVPLACAVAGLLIGFVALVRLAIDTESGAADATERPRVPRVALAAAGCVAVAALAVGMAPFIPAAARGAIAAAIGAP